MNAQIAFLQWVKKNHPQVLNAAVQRVQRKVSFGGLGDDLTSDITFDPGSLSVSDDASGALSQSVSNNPSYDTDWSGIISSVANAIPQVATTYVQTQAQLQTIQLNAQRAAQGLPPLNSSSLLTGQGLSSASLPMILLLGVGIFALATMAGKGNSSSAPGA